MSQDRQPKFSALLQELNDLAANAPARLSQRVAELSIREQAALALRLGARQRLELLLHAPQPMRLVHSLPDSEFYLSVREIGPTDGLPLMSLASATQIQHVLDLESWRGDRFDADRSGAWVALVLEAGESVLRQYLRAADDEQLTLLFQRWVRAKVMVSEEDPDVGGSGQTEVGDEEGAVSPDDNYRFSPAIAEHRPAIQRIAQILFLDQPKRYSDILWGASNELPSELEEGALRWRQSRMEEHGFPPWEDALSAYAPPDGVRVHPWPPLPTDPDSLSVPVSPLRLPTVGNQLQGALERLEDEARERALHEFFALGNRLIVADGSDTGDPALHRAALEKAAGYVGLALEVRGADDESKAAEVVVRVPLIELFREGYGQAVELQRRAHELSRTGWARIHSSALELLDSPIRERIAALLQPRPEYLEIGEDQATASRTRPFRSLSEIAETRVALELAEFLGQLMVDHLGLDLEHAIGRELPDRADTPQFSTFLLTFLAWHAVRDELRGDPLPHDVLADFLRNVASRRTAAPDAPTRALEALTHRLVESFDLGSRQLALLSSFGRACLEQLTAQTASLDPGIPVDPRYVSCLLIGEPRENLTGGR